MSVKNQFETLCAIEQISEKNYTRIAAQEISGAAPLEQDLPRAMAAVATEIDRQVQSYSSLDWLLYLRSPVFLRLTSWLADGMETAHHAEAFTGHSRQETLGFSVEAEGISPKWNPHRLRRVAQLIGGAFIYRQLRVFQSMLAMDVSFRASAPKEYPIPLRSEEQKENLRVFNARSYWQPMILSSGGGIAATAGKDDTEATTFACVGFDEHTRKFSVGPLGLSKFKQICALKIVHEDRMQEIGDLLLALKVGYIAARNAGMMEQLNRYGLICMQSNILATFFKNAESIVGSIQDLLPVWRYSDASAIVENLKHSGSELGYAPTVRVTSGCLALDLRSASVLLHILLFKSFTKHAAKRGPVFEDEVQHLINQTNWKPSDEIASWRNRKLKVGDQVLTDIDTIGEHNGTLLIIEVKAFYYGIGYGSADRSEARNVRGKVEEAVRNCSPEKLRTATNLDLRAFSRIVRVVCTPVPVYCVAEYAVPDDSGFSATMSYWELYKKLCE